MPPERPLEHVQLGAEHIQFGANIFSHRITRQQCKAANGFAGFAVCNDEGLHAVGDQFGRDRDAEVPLAAFVSRFKFEILKGCIEMGDAQKGRLVIVAVDGDDAFPDTGGEARFFEGYFWHLEPQISARG